MLNRRILRVKAMQALYAFHQAKVADVEVSRLTLEEVFIPDLNKDELPDKETLKTDRETAVRLFKKYYEKGQAPADDRVSGKLLKAVNHHILQYHELLSKDESAIKKNMLQELDKIYFHYLKFLLLVQEFALLDKRDEEKKLEKFSLGETTGHNFFKNPYVEAFKDFKSLGLEVIRKNVSWDNHRDQLKSWYKEIKKEDEIWGGYQAKSKPTDDDHLEIVNYMLKTVAFKKESIRLFMEEEDLYWSENKNIIKSLLNKTVKSFDENSEEKYTLMALNKNEEEDIPFFKKLYAETVKRDKEFEDTIASKAQNWEIGRMAVTDKIILKMALTEMINFPSIPVKVTINEYIELSKNYSTPKSKQFINGILDVLANELVEEGVVRKSGRGLIDNK